MCARRDMCACKSNKAKYTSEHISMQIFSKNGGILCYCRVGRFFHLILLLILNLHIPYIFILTIKKEEMIFSLLFVI